MDAPCCGCRDCSACHRRSRRSGRTRSGAAAAHGEAALAAGFAPDPFELAVDAGGDIHLNEVAALAVVGAIPAARRHLPPRCPTNEPIVILLVGKGAPMPDMILGEASQRTLGAAVEENLYALFAAMAALPDGELQESGPVRRHHTFPTNPMFKGAWRTRLSESDADDAIEETIAWFRARRAPFFFWWTGADTTPLDLESRLVRHGLLSMEAQSQVLARGIVQAATGAPCMAADLLAIDGSLVDRVPPDFLIEEVSDRHGLDSFRSVFVEAYGIPEWAGQAWVDATLAIGVGRTAWRIFLGRLDGDPVAISILFVGGGVASVYGVATVTAARNRGIGAAITLYPLLIARDLGYRYAVLFATEAGHSVYRRLGFKDCGVTINRYLWRAD